MKGRAGRLKRNTVYCTGGGSVNRLREMEGDRSRGYLPLDT